MLRPSLTDILRKTLRRLEDDDPRHEEPALDEVRKNILLAIADLERAKEHSKERSKNATEMESEKTESERAESEHDAIGGPVLFG